MKRSVGKMAAALALATLTLFGSAFQIGANPSRNYDNTFEETINVWPETPGTDVFSYTGIAAYAQANEEPLTPPADNSVPAEDSAQGEGELPPGEDPSEEDSPEENPPEEEPPEENPPEENPPEENPPEEETPEEEPPELPLLYKDGLILVYTYEQLLLIGGGSAVTNADADTETLGTGEAVNDENGQAVSYSLSGRYTLTHDIALPPDVIWQLPEGFTGSITPSAKADDRPLYDTGSDTITLYHPYQLEALVVEGREKRPVTTGDMAAESFGIGQLIYPQGDAGDYLTYAPSHRYVLSAQFDSRLPQPVGNAPIQPFAAGRTANDGRDFAGQVIKTLGGTTYILIGNEQQLRAIGSGKKVYTEVYQARRAVTHWEVDTNNNNPIMLYGGDADLLQAQNGTKNYSFGVVESAALTRGRCGVNQDTGVIDPSLDIENAGKGQTYAANANYIIFRDIDLSGSDWTPLMFHGTMLGAKATGTGTLWPDGAPLQPAPEKRPVISNVNVNQTADINANERMGIGFFATLTNEVNVSGAAIGQSASTVRVAGLVLNQVTVANTTSAPGSESTTLINGLLKLVGGALDFVAGGLLEELGISGDLTETLESILDANRHDPTALATGAFAGRIIGQVEVSNCAVTGATVQNAASHTGGFVGYVGGVTQYSDLSQLLGGVVSILENLLNFSPVRVIGLGDLITILLRNALPLDKLLPTGYTSPVLSNCAISGLGGAVGAVGKNYAGGFAGHLEGAQLVGCAVANSSYAVSANQYAGGFAGLARNGVAKGTLSGLNIDLVNAIRTESLMLNCSVNAGALGVSAAAADSYAGGFAGALANSFAVNCAANATGTLSVNSGGSHAGGFAGIATVGWQTGLGSNEVAYDTLLDGVTELVGDLAAQGSSPALLSLVGVGASAVLGCRVSGAALSVAAVGHYAGGLVGRLDGCNIADSSAGYLEGLPFWERAPGYADVAQQSSAVAGLAGVQAESYAGGVAGYAGTAHTAGLLNGVLGLTQYVGFVADNVQVSGVPAGYTVTAAESSAGGGFGVAIGGKVNAVVLSGLLRVEADDEAGGFAGVSGPGGEDGDGGLTLNLLGLDGLVNLSDLLAMGQNVQVSISNCSVTGAGAGYTVEATGEGGDDVTAGIVAAGFVAHSNSTDVDDSHAYNLKSVTAPQREGYAGGFVGISTTGGLADVGEDDLDTMLDKAGLLTVNGLVETAQYLVPDYTNCTVHYAGGNEPAGLRASADEPAGVYADVAGGFAADFQGGTMSNEANTVDGDADSGHYAVYDIDEVKGRRYAGGFAGRIYAGALAGAGRGISLLGSKGISVEAGDLLRVFSTYMPSISYAGVWSEDGFTVEAMQAAEDDVGSGSAGGFVGYAGGAQISYCDVRQLAHTTLTPPQELESAAATEYYDDDTVLYAVHGGRYAGGFVGDMDIGSAVSAESGLETLVGALGLSGLLDSMNLSVSTIEHSDVYGAPGGFSVRASSGADGAEEGSAGGFAGVVYGGRIQDSNAVNFAFIVGEVAAGGYAGQLLPGDAAKVLNGSDSGGLDDLLRPVLNTDGTMASLMSSFKTTVYNSSTRAVPCGGVVRADAPSDDDTQRGMAGGYVGLNRGARISGLNTDPWKEENTQGGDSKDHYNGDTSVCMALRIASVYGYEYAGGYTGLMECADMANAGSADVLGGLISVNNLLGALGVVYPSQENTAVYGPLANLDDATWNAWVAAVGQYGGYGAELAKKLLDANGTALPNQSQSYTYGYEVMAGRDTPEFMLTTGGGDAGGYVGLMNSGVLTNSMAYSVKQVSAMRGAGGFAGRVMTGGLTNLGGASILGLNLDLGNLASVAQAFVPIINHSSVYGYQSGLTVTASGPEDAGCGYAGGFVGGAYGAQIQTQGGKYPLPGNWPDIANCPAPAAACDAHMLRRVSGTEAAGGYAGLVAAASVTGADTDVASGLLQGVLDTVIGSPEDLLNVLEVTRAAIGAANVTAADPEWGFVVGGVGAQPPPNVAGGFAGSLEAAVVGSEGGSPADTQVRVSGLRSVNGGLYAGGFFGLADVGSAAQVGSEDPEDDDTTLLGGLAGLGDVNAVDVFRTTINRAAVTGVSEGITVRANSSVSDSTLGDERKAGCAGGFGGAMMNGVIKDSSVSNVATVQGLNYTGGFVGHLGKSGAADVDNVGILQGLVGGQVGVLDIFGATLENCSVAGFGMGMVVRAAGGEEPVAGGFVGYNDLARISGSSVTGLKKVESEEIAGGFVGKMDRSSGADVQLNSVVLEFLLGNVVSPLVKFLYVPEAERLNVPSLALGPLGEVSILSEGDTAHVNLLGLDIGVALVKDSPDAETGVAVINIGDSTIRLNCDNNGLTDDTPNVDLQLLKINRAKIQDSSVAGIATGYDVFGGGSGQDAAATSDVGASGGFAGLNQEGLLSGNQVIYCDVVRGTSGEVGPFTGVYSSGSVYDVNAQVSMEGEGNTYAVYREVDPAPLAAHKTAGGEAQISAATADSPAARYQYTRFDVAHMDVIKQFADLDGAVMRYGDADDQPLEAYAGADMALLMLNANAPDNPAAQIPEPGEIADPCYEMVNYTIQKLWMDWNSPDGTRPDTIQIRILQTMVSADGEPLEGEPVLLELDAGAMGYSVAMSATEHQTADSAAIWRRVVELPVVLTEGEGGEPVVYYHYTFEEVPVEHYAARVEVNTALNEVSIVNSYLPMLPASGGVGDLWYVAGGSGLLLLAMALQKRRGARRKVSYTGYSKYMQYRKGGKK